MSTPAFFIRQIPIHGKLILSPMQGYSDLPYRSICRELGSAISYTEFINTIEVLQRAPRLAYRLAYLPEERPVVYQIFDNDLQRIIQATQLLQDLEPDIIDINMGCSVRRISSRGAGAGLLRTPLKVAHIFKQLTHRLSIPVTAKIRLGWDEDQLNYCLIARIIEENGGAAIAVHGRTKAQGYGGKADWEAIAEIKQAVSIPVIANGDVRTVSDIREIEKITACDGVMIGRAAIGNPWIFSYLDRQQVPKAKVHQMVLSHLERMLKFYGAERGLVLFRKHANQYLSPHRLSREERLKLLTCERPVEFIRTLESINL